MLQSIDENVASSVAATSESYRQLVRAEAHANAYRKVSFLGARNSAVLALTRVLTLWPLLVVPCTV
jgi:hypothetical protein